MLDHQQKPADSFHGCSGWLQGSTGVSELGHYEAGNQITIQSHDKEIHTRSRMCV